MRLTTGLMRRTGGALFILMLASVAAAEAQPLRLILPTDNDALLRGDGPEFYQFTDRNYRGVRTHPWQGGQYGFVRNLEDTPGGAVYTRFHEGLDIRPLYRDGNGEPLDTVRAVDDGRVVYVNFEPRDSNYGKYVVVEHIWSGSPFYSLYAHMSDARVHRNQRVRRGDPLGIMGYTGRGIDKRRAHVHFEINMLLSEGFDEWHGRHFRRSENNHGHFNGLNLAGIDVAALYLARQRNPNLTIREFFRLQEPYFAVLMPARHVTDLQYRYPWLAGPGFDAAAPSVEISFSQSGQPLRIMSTYRRVEEPEVVWAADAEASYNLTTNHLAGSGSRVTLSNSGRRYLDLLTMPTDRTRAGGVPVVAEEAPATPAPVSPTITAAPVPETRVVVAPPPPRPKEEPKPEPRPAKPKRRFRGW